MVLFQLLEEVLVTLRDSHSSADLSGMSLPVTLHECMWQVKLQGHHLLQIDMLDCTSRGSVVLTCRSMLYAEADAAALAECRAWVSSLQAFVMEVDMQVRSPNHSTFPGCDRTTPPDGVSMQRVPVITEASLRLLVKLSASGG